MKFITQQYVRESQNTIFVFGDNMLRKGFGGQAAAMRGEPNAIGIPTKWTPTQNQGAYFKDVDFEKVKPSIDAALEQLKFFLDSGLDIILPEDGIGTGLAKLPQRAPMIYEYICSKLKELENPRCL